MGQSAFENVIKLVARNIATNNTEVAKYGVACRGSRGAEDDFLFLLIVPQWFKRSARRIIRPIYRKLSKAGSSQNTARHGGQVGLSNSPYDESSDHENGQNCPSPASRWDVGGDPLATLGTFLRAFVNGFAAGRAGDFVNAGILRRPVAGVRPFVVFQVV